MGGNPGDFGQIEGSQQGGFTGLFGDLFTAAPVFAIFFGVVALFIAAVFVVVIVQVFRGKGRRYVMMEVNDDGSMRPVPMPGNSMGFSAHDAAHQQAVQQSMNQQIINQQMFPPQPPTGI